MFNITQLLEAGERSANLSEIVAPMELQLTYTVLEVLVAVVAVTGNALVIAVFRRERRLRRRTNYYIVSLATADLLVGLLGIPFAILASLGLPRDLHACLFTVSVLVVLCTISIFSLVAVSVDRYWAILHPMGYSRNVRTRTAIVMISICWVAGAAVGFLPLFGWHSVSEPELQCYFVKVMDYDYLMFLYFATIITPSLLLAAFYAHIYRVVVKQLGETVRVSPGGRRGGGGGTMLRVLGAAQKREVKATQNLAIIVFFFMICWIPLYTINAIKAFWPDYDIHATYTELCIILSHLNSAVNPLLYAYHLKDFRAALEKLLCGPARREPSVCKPSPGRGRPALERCNALRDRPRLYVDSPVWARQQAERAAAAAAARLSPLHEPRADAEPFLPRAEPGPFLVEEAERSPYRRVEELLRRVRSAGASADS